MQTSNHLLMVEPAAFGYNRETAVNNLFQRATDENLQEKALAEWNGLLDALRKNRVQVTVIKDSAHPPTPDAIFPNNWISFHPGRYILYPMFAENRRMEPKKLLSLLDGITNTIAQETDLRLYEQEGIFLEGTGSMVLDRTHKIAYACRSARTHESLFRDCCGIIGYRPVIFDAMDTSGQAVYHTNVMMSIGKSVAVVCLDAITPGIDRLTVTASIEDSGLTLVPITPEQMHAFAGNMLLVGNAEDACFWVMSDRAYQSLTDSQLNALSVDGGFIHAPLHNIEDAGGGSARCMLAEVFA